MAEPWQPLLELIESFADLLALARRTTAGPSVIEAAVERFRDALVDDSEIELNSLEIAADSPDRLMALVREEHLAAPPVAPVRPMVYRDPNGTSPDRRRAETRARRAGYRVAGGRCPPTGIAGARERDLIRVKS